jgi:DNA-binding protein H-NS
MSQDALDRIAGNKNVARAAARRLSADQLNKLTEVFMEVMEEKEQEFEKKKAEEAAKAQKLVEIKQQLEDAGLSVEDIAKVTTKRRGRPPKKESQSESAEA